MARKKRKAKSRIAYKRKRRTREHVIADLSTNHVERLVFRCSYTVDRVEKDYGFDLVMSTYDGRGQFENGNIYMQLKATDNVRWTNRGTQLSFSLSVRDLNHWLKEPYPVVLILYDAGSGSAYYLYIQAYFDGLRISRKRASVVVHIPKGNLLTEAAVRRFRDWKSSVLGQLQGKITHRAS